ncbi:MAG: TrmO family methyltransferase, partial [Planctomycetota bacterium]|nr:TrmO family methyltransferase [Planctomycetota bacterium]
ASHIGLSVVELVKVEGKRLLIRDVDVLDGTPLLDIKPYIPRFDARANTRTGWMLSSDSEIRDRRSDDRFA